MTTMTTATKHVLVIDDDRKISELFVDVFHERYDIATAPDGAAGLAAVKARRPDVVLLDINMPGMSGLEVLGVIRRLDDRIPVIVITGNGSGADAEAALRGGAFAYLPKPFHITYLEHLVAAALRAPG
jgi:DNA-binding NtrC family response regulator